jgi:hypothetical protein
MKTMKKLQVAVAVATLFAASGSAMAWSISQSGVTIAREVIAKTPAPTNQVLRAPSVTTNFDNGPTANANSSQDFNITLQLSGDGNPTWSAGAGTPATYKSVSANRRNNGGTPVNISLPGTTAALASGIELLGVDVGTTNGTTGIYTQGTGAATIRYRFRLVNNTAQSVNLGDLQVAFNTVNPLAAPVEADYAHVATLENSVNAIVGSTIGTSGTAADACGNADTRVTVTGRNFIGSGDGVLGESGPLGSLNNGYILFAQALNIQVGTGVAQNRSTDVNFNNTSLTTPGNTFGNAFTMPLGFVKFSNRTLLDAWDLDVAGRFYKFQPAAVSPLDGDFNGLPLNTDGDVDIDVTGNPLFVTITSTNGFASGSTFQLANNPYCTLGAAGAAGTAGGAGATAVTASPDGLTYTVQFSHATLIAATSTGGVGTLASTTGPASGPTSTVTGYVPTTDRYYVCYTVPGNTSVPLSSFTAVATLNKQGGALEQANVSCPGPFAGLGGGIKIDVRNFFPWNPANTNSVWLGVIRVINNSETTTADLTGQYIRADDGKYGKWGSLGNLAPRAARYFTSKEIFDALTNNSTTAGAPITDNTGSGGLTSANGQALPANTRLRISSGAASTLRVQSYIYNSTTQSLVEVSASQGADFVNIESAPRDHIDQDAQTGIKK